MSLSERGLRLHHLYLGLAPLLVVLQAPLANVGISAVDVFLLNFLTGRRDILTLSMKDGRQQRQRHGGEDK